MLLYWGLFTVGFTVGAILSFLTFAAGKPEQEEIYDDYINQLFVNFIHTLNLLLCS